MLRDSKGITLIVLVSTIVVLLILAGVSLTLIASENGILKKPPLLQIKVKLQKMVLIV